MKVKTQITDSQGLQNLLNEIGYQNVLQILPEHCSDGTLFIIIYKDTTFDAIQCVPVNDRHFD